MVVFQITEDKKEEMSELCNKMLHYGGKLMQCIENMNEEGSMGMRGSYGMGMRQDGGRYMGMRYEDPMGMRGGYGMREDYPDMMGERRDRYGRFMPR